MLFPNSTNLSHCREMWYLTGLLIARKSSSCVLDEKVNEGSILRRNLAERQYLLGKFCPRPTTPQLSIVCPSWSNKISRPYRIL